MFPMLHSLSQMSSQKQLQIRYLMAKKAGKQVHSKPKYVLSLYGKMGMKRGAISPFPSPNLPYKQRVAHCILSEMQEFDRRIDKLLSNIHAELKGIWKGELFIC